MTKKRIYKLSLLLPIVLPLLFLPLFPYVSSMNATVAGIVMVILYSGYIGGIPYLITVIPMLIWTRNQSDIEFRKMLLSLSLLMLIPLGILFGIVQFVTSPGVTIRDTLLMFVTFYLFFALCTLVFGYAYVGIAFALGSLFSPESESEF